MYLNFKTTLRNSFLNFIRYFYDENLTYPETILRKWIKFFIPFFITIFLTGLVFYLFLYGSIWIFPRLSSYIFLGERFWQVPIIILFLGLIRWFGEDLYKFIKHGGKR